MSTHRGQFTRVSFSRPFQSPGPSAVCPAAKAREQHPAPAPPQPCSQPALSHPGSRQCLGLLGSLLLSEDWGRSFVSAASGDYRSWGTAPVPGATTATGTGDHNNVSGTSQCTCAAFDLSEWHTDLVKFYINKNKDTSTLWKLLLLPIFWSPHLPEALL